jgi:hypothetical protein
MSDSSDIDALHTKVILLKMRGKTTEELMSMLAEKSLEHWTQEEREAAQRVLQERTGKLPEQTAIELQRTAQIKSKQLIDTHEARWQPFFKLSPLGTLMAATAIFVLSGFLIGFIFINMGKENTKWFLIFTESAKLSDIEKIEVQKLDLARNSIGDAITVNDQKSIGEFVAVLKTIEENATYHPPRENRIKVKIWLTKKNQTIELEGYTLPGEGRTLLISNLRIEPRAWSSGDGYIEFPAPDFYDWLVKIGMELQ